MERMVDRLMDPLRIRARSEMQSVVYAEAQIIEAESSIKQSVDCSDS